LTAIVRANWIMTLPVFLGSAVICAYLFLTAPPPPVDAPPLPLLRRDSPTAAIGLVALTYCFWFPVASYFIFSGIQALHPQPCLCANTYRLIAWITEIPVAYILSLALVIFSCGAVVYTSVLISCLRHKR
jgi:hypothetical protein